MLENYEKKWKITKKLENDQKMLENVQKVEFFSKDYIFYQVDIFLES